MEIVTSSNMIRRFRGIKEFQMNLGLSKTTEINKEGTKSGQQIIIKIKDPFVKRYLMLTGNYLVKSGNIGSLNFYMDNSVGYNNFLIYDKDKEYKFDFKDTGDIRSYLSDILDKILNNELTPTNLEMNMEEEIEFRLDKNLPQREFLEKQKEMQEEMARMKI
jgi:hypothetical protein